MAETSAIEWCDSTFNPWIGCTKVSPACDHCYAEAMMDKRHHRVEWGGTRRRTSPVNWQQPRRWQRQTPAFAAEHGRRRRVFCASLADVFDNQVPAEWRDSLWALILDTPDLDWLLLTKRPQNIGKMLPRFWDVVKGHVWLGTTVEDQERAINLWHLGCAAQEHGCAVTFASFEPLLEQVDPSRVVIHSGKASFPYDPSITHADIIFNALRGAPSLSIPALGWVIAGGESGPGARPSNPDWFRSLRDQCGPAGIPFLFKQWGSWVGGDFFFDLEDHLHFLTQDDRRVSITSDHSREHYWNLETMPEGVGSMRVTKTFAGRLLDGIEHNGFPDGAA